MYNCRCRNRLITVLATNSLDHLNWPRTSATDTNVFDRRVPKRSDEDGNFSIDRREKYVGDGDDVVLDFLDPDGDGAAPFELATRYLHGPAVDQFLAQEGAKTNEVQWMLADNLGTVRDLVDNNGDIVEHYTYDAYGNLVGIYDAAGNSVAGDPQTRYLYTGREWDSDAGLYYYRARWYDAETGRFISEDPIGFAAEDANLARYVENAPTLYVDPSGLQPGGIAIPAGRALAPAIDAASAASTATALGTTAGLVGAKTLQFQAMGSFRANARNGRIVKLLEDAVADCRITREDAAEIANRLQQLPLISRRRIPNSPWYEAFLDRGYEIVDSLPHSLPAITNRVNQEIIQAQAKRQQECDDQRRVAEQRERRRIRRENQSREAVGQNRSGEGFRDHESAHKGPRGQRPKGPGGRNRERNIGIDEEHSRVPKGTGGGQQRFK